MKNYLKLIILITLLTVNSCAYRPILEPNDKYQMVGEEASKHDVDACMNEGDAYLKQYKAEKIRKDAARSAAVGTAVGAVTGAIFGKGLKSAGVGALVGLGAGAFLGASGAATEGYVKPDVLKQRYVNHCLNNKGYSVLGWQ
jgi:hypothetical protein